MKKAIIIALFCVAACIRATGAAAEGADEINALFYQGNAFYQQKDFANALLSYDKILDAGYDSANLYYNIGNSFLRMNKLGFAILFYERARRIAPRDGDTRSNLAYARSLAGEQPFDDLTGGAVIRAVKYPLKDVPIGTAAALAYLLYLAVIALCALRIVNPVAGKRIRWATFLVFVAALAVIVSAASRYRDEIVRSRGIVLAKEADCRYEPIDKAASYFKVREGSEVIIESVSGDWRMIRRPDGRAGWVRKEAVEAI